MVGEEGELPYNRTPLSKELWHTDDPQIAENLVYKQWDGKHRSLYYESPSSFLDPFTEEGAEELRRPKRAKGAKKEAQAAPQPEGTPAAEGAPAQTPAAEEPKPLPNHIKIVRNNKAVSLNVDTQMVTLANGQKVYYEKVGHLSARAPFVESSPNDLLLLALDCHRWNPQDPPRHEEHGAGDCRARHHLQEAV